jgi:hypothetical protein
MPDGTLVMTYLDTTNDGVQEGLATIMVVISPDAGQTLSQPIQAGVFRELHFQPRNSSFRYWGAAFPQLAVGPNNDIYIATTVRSSDTPTDDGDIVLMRSLDKGQTWQPPARINQDDTDRAQFFPSIAVSADGVLHAMWGDMRDDPEEARYHIYYTRSDDQGETFGFENAEIGLNVPDTRVTDFPSNSLRGFPGGRFIGDYFSLAANEDDVYMVWADTRLGEFEASCELVHVDLQVFCTQGFQVSAIIPFDLLVQTLQYLFGASPITLFCRALRVVQVLQELLGTLVLSLASLVQVANGVLHALEADGRRQRGHHHVRPLGDRSFLIFGVHVVGIPDSTSGGRIQEIGLARRADLGEGCREPSLCRVLSGA